MMSGEQLGIGHEPRHGTAYVQSWVKALQDDPKEIRAAAVDAQRISDWLLARERERSLTDDQTEHERPDGGEPAQRSVGGTREHGDPERSPGAVPEARDQSQAEHDAARRDIGWSPQVINPPAVGAPRRDVGPSR